MKRIQTILLMLFITLMISAKGQYILVIDAGHGGHDSGAVGAFSYEKNINLNTALAFGRYVEANCPDVKVIYTRKTDVFIPLHQRAEIANKNHADVFISIHTNSAGSASKTVKGLETYTMGMRRSNEKLSAAKRENSVITIEKDYKERYAGYDANSPESSIMFEFINDRNMAKSVELAQLVQKNVCANAGCINKGVKQDVFLVLRETSMPACLIELGFISTPDEERMLNENVYIDNIARGIYQAFVRYKGSGPVNVKAQVDRSTQPADKVSQPEPTKKVEQKPAQKVEQKQEQKPAQKVEQKPAQKQEQKADDRPVFKVQIFSYHKKLSSGDSRFKGEQADNYVEGGTYKYTVGTTSDYKEIQQLKSQLTEKFPDAFIIAFKNGERMDVTQAVKESRNQK